MSCWELAIRAHDLFAGLVRGLNPILLLRVVVFQEVASPKAGSGQIRCD